MKAFAVAFAVALLVAFALFAGLDCRDEPEEAAPEMCEIWEMSADAEARMVAVVSLEECSRLSGVEPDASIAPAGEP